MQPDPIDELSALAPPVAAILTDWELSAFGDVVAGLEVLDLTSDGGETALALAESGARVLNIGSSFPDVEVLLASLSDGIDLDAYPGEWRQLPDELRREFDLVYAGPATLEWVEVLPDWVADAFEALKPGGRLVMYDENPAAREFAGTTEAAGLEPAGDEAFDLPGAPDDLLPEDAEWTLDELREALTATGFVIERLDELTGMQRFLSAVDELDEAAYPEIASMPRAFGMIARKPA